MLYKACFECFNIIVTKEGRFYCNFIRVEETNQKKL